MDFGEFLEGDVTSENLVDGNEVIEACRGDWRGREEEKEMLFAIDDEFLSRGEEPESFRSAEIKDDDFAEFREPAGFLPEKKIPELLDGFVNSIDEGNLVEELRDCARNLFLLLDFSGGGADESDDRNDDRVADSDDDPFRDIRNEVDGAENVGEEGAQADQPI